MESTLAGVILDSSVLIAAERRNLAPAKVLKLVEKSVGEIPIAICSITVAEIGHGIYRASDPEVRERRRRFLDEIEITVPIYAVTENTAELIARIGGEQAAKGVNLPLADLIIGACALELGYALATGNVRQFKRIPGLAVVQF